MAPAAGLDDHDAGPILLQNLDQLLPIGREAPHLPRRFRRLVSADHALVFAQINAQNDAVDADLRVDVDALHGKLVPRLAWILSARKGFWDGGSKCGVLPEVSS